MRDAQTRKYDAECFMQVIESHHHVDHTKDCKSGSKLKLYSILINYIFTVYNGKYCVIYFTI